MVVCIPGPSALSVFRAIRLLASLRGAAPAVRKVEARFVHFAELARELDEAENWLLRQVLRYGPVESEAESGETLLVTPRIGTISPWSSKATEIVRRCGLEAVCRVERGIAYALRLDGDLSALQRDAVKALLHDRMTQTVLSRGQEETLFRHREPEPLQYVPLMQEGRWALVKANAGLGLALSEDELDYLEASYRAMSRNPSAVSYTHLTLPTN